MLNFWFLVLQMTKNIMIRLKYRCFLFVCLALCIVSILSINLFLVWQNSRKQHRSHQRKFSIIYDDNDNVQSVNNSDYDDYKNSNHLMVVSDQSNQKQHPISTSFKPFLDSTKIFKNYHLKRDYDASSKLWFMSNGTIWPNSGQTNDHDDEYLALWPEETINDNKIDPMNDRIVNQLMYIPKNYDEQRFVPKGKLPLKKILLAHGRHSWNDLQLGRKRFIQDRCPVNACFIMADQNLINKADAVLFRDRFVWPKFGRPNYDQIWILFLLECPYNTQLFNSLPSNIINWTATYRHDSDIVAPYEKFVHYDLIYDHQQQNQQSAQAQIPTKNYADGKTKKVAWFVSNCGAKNKRLEYARELSKYIDVDIYGSCGKLKCPRTKAKQCFEMLNKDYKFYLAFENSNCRDYITEKFFVNGLGHNSQLNVLPIVMGAHPDDYQRSAPPNSYIHVDDFQSPRHLAQYLHILDQNDQLYNSYFQWKSSPSINGEFINTYFWCRLCAMLHAVDERYWIRSKSYENIQQWWAPKNICRDGTAKWKQPNQQQPNLQAKNVSSS